MPSRLHSAHFHHPASGCPASGGAAFQAYVEIWFKYRTDFAGVLTSSRKHLTELLDASTELNRLLHVLEESPAALAAAQSETVIGRAAWRTSLNPLTAAAHDGLLRARRASFLARRSVEARLAVDLNEITQDLGTVASPAQWADNVFGGTRSLFTDESPKLYSPSALNLFDATLKEYISAHAVTFPYVSGTTERVFPLRALLKSNVGNINDVHVVDYLAATCADGTVKPPQINACSALSGLDTRCSGKVARYDALFSLDAVATNATPTAEGAPLMPWVVSADDEYNFRTLTIGLNILGTNVVATNPETGFGAVAYRLRHCGDTSVVDASLVEHLLRMPATSISSGEGRVGGSKLGTPLVGDQLASMEPYLRGEFQGRPPGGTYTLTLRPCDGALCNATDIEVVCKGAFLDPR